jgi:hypothetical protein
LQKLAHIVHSDTQHERFAGTAEQRDQLSMQRKRSLM